METYADAVSRNDRFPAILVRREGKQYVRPDGNHRFAADVRNERPNIPAYEVFVSGMQTTVLAFRANARHGVPNAENERLSHAVYLLDSEGSLAQAAAFCMVSPFSMNPAGTVQNPKRGSMARLHSRILSSHCGTHPKTSKGFL